MTDPDIRQNAGRCDWCGKPIDMSNGDTLSISTAEDVAPPDGFSAEDVFESIADAVARMGGGANEDLADTIRENHAYRLHKRCEEESQLSEIYE